MPFFFSAQIFALKWHSDVKTLNSVVIVNNSAIFDRKVSTVFELSFSTFSNYGESDFLARVIIIGSAFACFSTCILSQSSIIFIHFWKFQIIVQSLNSPKFENRSLSDDLCKSMLKWRCMLKSNCDREFCSWMWSCQSS